MKIQKQKDGTYTVHFDGEYTAYLNGTRIDYPALGFYSIEDAKYFIRRIVVSHRVVFIHLIPRVWWVVKW